MTIARTAIDDVFDGAAAVLGARSVPPIIVTQTIGTGRFDRHRNAIEIDPKVLTWPLECRRFLGAHEAAHAVQAELPRRWALIVLAVVMTGYLGFVSATAIKFGFGTTCSSSRSRPPSAPASGMSRMRRKPAVDGWQLPISTFIGSGTARSFR